MLLHLHAYTCGNINLHTQSFKYLPDTAPMRDCHVNHIWRNLSFFLQSGHVYQPIAMQLCKSQSHDTLRVILEARGGGDFYLYPP